MAQLDFKAMFNNYMASNQKKWGHDRAKTLGGSEAFGCIRKAYYKRNNTPVDPDWEDGWGATERGNLIENYFVVPAIEHAADDIGFEYLLGGENQVTLFDGVEQEDSYEEEEQAAASGVLSVTPDGLITGVSRDALLKYGVADLGPNPCFMLEIKSIDPRVDLSEEKSIHHGQVQIQMGLIRRNTVFRPNYAVILYINASFLDDIEVFIVPFDEKKFEIAQKRADWVFKTTDPSKLPREGKIDGSCQYCPYQVACMGTVKEGFPTVKAKKAADFPPGFLDDIEPLVAARRAASFDVKKAEKRLETLNEEIKTVCRTYGVSNPKSPEGNWSVSYTLASGRKMLDKDALAADGIDVDQYMKEGNPYEILRVTFKDLQDAE